MNGTDARRLDARSCLGVTLSAREVGYCAVVIGSPVRDGVLRLRAALSPDERLRRFAVLLAELLDTYAPAELSVVLFAPADLRQPEALVTRERAVAVAECARRGIAMSETSAHDVRRALLPGVVRPSNRALASCLADRYPSVWRGSLAATPAPEVTWRGDGAPPQRARTSRELYYRGLVLALGAATLVLKRVAHEQQLSAVVCPNDLAGDALTL
jgi:hypothetical protein